MTGQSLRLDISGGFISLVMIAFFMNPAAGSVGDMHVQSSTTIRSQTSGNTIFGVNNLSLYGKYVSKSDSAWIVIKNISSLKQDSDSAVIIEWSIFEDFSVVCGDTLFAVSSLLAAGSCDSFIVDKIGKMPILKDTMHLRWYITDINNEQSVTKTSCFVIGWDRPSYAGHITAMKTSRPDQIALFWIKPYLLGLAGVDSIRIWWDTLPIPTNHIVDLPQSQAFYVSPYDSDDTLKNCSGNTKYYFGLQIYKDCFWSTITAKARDSIRTATWDTTITEPNTIAIDTAWFQTQSNRMFIQWHIKIDTTINDAVYKCGYTYTLNNAVDTLHYPLTMDSIQNGTTVSIIDFGQNIVFDTTYTIGLWLSRFSKEKGLAKPSAPTDSSICRIRVPSFTWQAVMLDYNDTLAYGACEKIILQKEPGYTFNDTLRSYTYTGQLPSGFLDVGGVSFQFSNKNHQVPSFTLGLRYTHLPSGVTPDDVGLYRDSAGSLVVVHGFTRRDSAVWGTLTMDDFAYPFLILADTASPAIEVQSASDTVVEPVKLSTTFRICDNVPNTKWYFFYGSGNEGLPYRDSGFIDPSRDSGFVCASVIDTSGKIFSQFHGFRALVIADDGAHRDTVNVSRVIRGSQTTKVSITENTWTPLQVSKVLDDQSIETLFSQTTSNNLAWEYDTRKTRLFRYCSSDTDSCNTWKEYSKEISELFSLKPGRIIWCKTRESYTLDYGTGVTLSLKESCKILLKPNAWTDFALPYTFPVMLRDVLEHTGRASDSLVIYHWRSEGTSYIPHNVFAAGLDRVQEMGDTLHADQKFNCYTIYNCQTEIETLVIPPVCIPLSQTATARRPVNRNKDDRWDVSFLWHTESLSSQQNHDPVVRRIRCGFNKDLESEVFYGPLPPTFGSIDAGVYDSTTDQLGGYAIRNNLSDGGFIYRIRFQNSAAVSQKVFYKLENAIELPPGFKACIYNPEISAYEYQETGCTLAGQSTVERWVVVGTDKFVQTTSKQIPRLKLAFVGAYPNPFQNSFVVHYTIASDISEIRLDTYDTKGRMLWTHTVYHNSQPGNHIFRYPHDATRSTQLPSLSAGVYIVRMTARSRTGTITKVGEKKLTCIR